MPYSQDNDNYFVTTRKHELITYDNFINGKCIEVHHVNMWIKRDEYQLETWLVFKTNPEYQLLNEQIWRLNESIDVLQDESTSAGREEIANDVVGILLGMPHGALEDIMASLGKYMIGNNLRSIR